MNPVNRLQTHFAWTPSSRLVSRKPAPQEPDFKIHQTNIIIHPSYNSIIGYIEENNIHLQKNKEVEEACQYYQLKFIEYKDL